MKPITIRNQQYYYKISTDTPVGYTFFYDKEDSEESIFYLNFSIESSYNSKTWTREQVESVQRRYQTIEDRKLEIERGEII